MNYSVLIIASLNSLNSFFFTFFSDEVIQFTAITWLREFITLSGRTTLPFNAGILKAILPCMAYEQDKQNILL